MHIRIITNFVLLTDNTTYTHTNIFKKLITIEYEILQLMDGIIQSKFVQCIIDDQIMKLGTSAPTIHYWNTDSRTQPRGLYFALCRYTRLLNLLLPGSLLDVSERPKNQ